MGCLRLTYRPSFEVLKGGSKKELTNKKSVLNLRSVYLYGFNNMEKDDELKGSGNSYDFGARMYDPRVGRWLTIDPLSAKYPSFTPYSFVNNMPIMAIDPDGKDIIILSAPSGANNLGHGAVLIGNDTDGWKFYSKNGTENHGMFGESYNANLGTPYLTLSDFANSKDNFKHGEPYYTGAFRITSNKETDVKMKEAAMNQCKIDYNLFTASCIDVCSDALIAGGFDPGLKQMSHDPEDKTLPDIPNVRYPEITKNNKGTDVTSKIQPTPAVLEAEKTLNANLNGPIVDMGVKYHGQDSDNTRVYNPQEVKPSFEQMKKFDQTKQKASETIKKVRDGITSRAKTVK